MSEARKDRWDKLEIVLRPLGGLIAGLAIAALGFVTKDYLAGRESENRRERLYTELMSRREESASSLRSAMFQSIIESFLRPESSGPSLETEILHLELLVRNFHESLDLAPLFKHLNRRIEAQDLSAEESDLFRGRLASLAFEISFKQTIALAARGDIEPARFDFECPVETADPETSRQSRCEVRPDEVAASGTAGSGTLSVNSDLDFAFWLEDVEPATDSLMMSLEIYDRDRDLLKEASFWVSPFDFPMIDNIRMPGGERVAVVLRDLDFTKPDGANAEVEEASLAGQASLTVLAFPGEYASLKERVFIQDILEGFKPDAGLETDQAGPG